MIWTYNDEGYLVSVDVPASAKCRNCGAEYVRQVSDARPWQESKGDVCPSCGRDHGTVTGVSFTNTLLELKGGASA